MEKLPKQTTCKEFTHKEETDVTDLGLRASGNRLTTMKKEHRIPASCRLLIYAPSPHRMEKVIFFPLCHFAIIFSCVAVMTPSSRKNSIRLFCSWFWSLVSDSYRWKGGDRGRGLSRKNCFPLQVCQRWIPSFPFHLNMLTNTQTPKLDLTLRWRDETLIYQVIKRSCNMCSQIGYIMISLSSLVLHARVKNIALKYWVVLHFI